MTERYSRHKVFTEMCVTGFMLLWGWTIPASVRMCWSRCFETSEHWSPTPAGWRSLKRLDTVRQRHWVAVWRPQASSHTKSTKRQLYGVQTNKLAPDIDPKVLYDNARDEQLKLNIALQVLLSWIGKWKKTFNMLNLVKTLGSDNITVEISDFLD